MAATSIAIKAAMGKNLDIVPPVPHPVPSGGRMRLCALTHGTLPDSGRC
jgi:hypothetical protein